MIDFECALFDGDSVSKPLGALGFAAPASKDQRQYDRDTQALSRILLMMLLPIVPVLSLDQGKFGMLSEAAASLFSIDENISFKLRPVIARLPRRSPEYTADPILIDDENWPAMRDALVQGIMARATPQRKDLLFRSDALQFAHGCASFAYGSAGIIYALQKVVGHVPPELTNHMYRMARDGNGCLGGGFFDGLHGAAHTLLITGRDDQAAETLNAAMARPLPSSDAFFGGKAGVILNLLHFADALGDDSLSGRADELGSELANTVISDDQALAQLPAGLLHGYSGLAVLFVRLYEHTRRQLFLNAAEIALRRDMHSGRLLDDGVYHLFKNPKYLIYFDEGSIGLGLALDRFVVHRPIPEFEKILGEIRHGCTIPFVMQPGLFQGRTGLIAALADSDRQCDSRAGRDQAARLNWHALHINNHIAFPGNGLTKVSDDFATGSAGILLVLDALFTRRQPELPFLSKTADTEEVGI
ncbi:MAG: lanthionine synthetase C family protein [Sphingomonadaceae bacterium]|nr:lanthionine synthetase C family protein [Sphingomonadaceae bacterium]